MHELYELREKLCKNLKAYSKKSEITGQSLEMVDALAHSIKNIDKIIENDEESEGLRGRSERGMYRGSYEGYNDMSRGGSYARGRGAGARRDSMGRYSSDGYSGNDEMVSELREMMQDAQDEKTRMEFQKFISKIESM